MKNFKNLFLLGGIFATSFLLTGCNSNPTPTQTQQEPTVSVVDEITTNDEPTVENNVNNQDSSAEKKIAIVYFSKTNNTDTVANYIHDKVGGDIYEIEVVNPYPEDYTETTKIAREEQDNNARPEIVEAYDMSEYDIVFIGCPVWWGTMPMAMFTWIDSQDFSGKTIVPFTTHEGSGLGRVPSDLESNTNAETYLQGLAIRGGSVSSARDDVNTWIDNLGL